MQVCMKDSLFSTVKIWDFGAIWGYLQRGDFVSKTHIYHYAKFHADRCHRRRDICNRTDTKIERITADNISDKTHTGVAYVDNNPPRGNGFKYFREAFFITESGPWPYQMALKDCERSPVFTHSSCMMYVTDRQTYRRTDGKTISIAQR